MKAVIEQLDTIAKEHLQIIKQLSHDTKIVAWSKFHGWIPSDTESHLLFARQALLNDIIRQTFPNLTYYEIPFDFIKAPKMLVKKINEMALNSKSFNFWGDLYNVLVPQSKRRQMGQFWTDGNIAEWMVEWLLRFKPSLLVDVGCGAGNFLIKAAQYLQSSDHITRLQGFDISPLMLNVTQAALSTHKLPLVELSVRNYLEFSLPTYADTIICNPPYTRHHHIIQSEKDRLQEFFKRKFNLVVSRKATMAFYFLMKLIAEMPEGARSAIIVPMEVLDADYGITAKYILCQQTILSAIIHFSKEMNAFHKVDVGASILFFRKGYEKNNKVCHLTLETIPTKEDLLSCFDIDQSQDLPFGSLVIQPQNELLKIPKWSGITSFTSKNSKWEQSGLVVPLKALARVMRGIATGANKFFALSTQEVKQRSLEPYVVRTIQRNREIQDIIIDETVWQKLSNEGKRVWLLYLNSRDSNLPSEILTYISNGEENNYHQRSLVQTRKKWYLMEQRDIPPIFFTILTRGNPRFILNKSGVRPLNMFSLVYPNNHILKSDCLEYLWALLNSNFSISQLHSVSRTYGGNTLKVEPRELGNLPVINPLALPDEFKQKIRELIDDFYYHRKTNIFLGEINSLVDKLLDSKITIQYQTSLPEQLQLLDERGCYSEII